MALANEKALARLPKPGLEIDRDWNHRISQIQVQLAQLKAVFEKASVMLVKSDFDRLLSMEVSLLKVKQKIGQLIKLTKSPILGRPLLSRAKLKTLADAIDRELIAQQSRLDRFKKEKFSKHSTPNTCL
jgi:hypothetical protein